MEPLILAVLRGTITSRYDRQAAKVSSYLDAQSEPVTIAEKVRDESFHWGAFNNKLTGGI